MGLAASDLYVGFLSATLSSASFIDFYLLEAAVEASSGKRCCDWRSVG